MDHMGVLRISAELNELEAMRRFIEEQAQALGVESSAVYDVLLAMEELSINIVLHGYRGQPGTIEVEMRTVGDALEVRLRDQAPPFDPTLAPTPDITLPLELRPPGGMGILLARHFMDSMIYHRLPQGGNELILVKQGVVGTSAKAETPTPD
jgi:serine/threonine-protein kinase RsbW